MGAKDDRAECIKARLSEGRSVDDLKQAINGCNASAFHMGENPERRVHDSLTLICRDAEKVDAFMERATKASSVPPANRVDEDGRVFNNGLETFESQMRRRARAQEQAS